MSTDKAQTEWMAIKGKIKNKWNKLVDTDIDTFKGNMDLIADKIQTAYGYTKDKAQQEYHDFKKSLEPATPVVEKPKAN